MPPRPIFVLFGPAHLAVLALSFLLPVVLALAARRASERWGDAPDRLIRLGLAAILAGGWLSWYGLFWVRGWLDPANALPLNLCDWAAAALILALLRPGQLAYELGYFWGLGGTLQGLITPDIAYGFPDPQFVFFSINHAGIMTALLYLSLPRSKGKKPMRPVPASLPRVAAATFGYVAVAGAADFVFHVNYGFLAAKPANASLIDFLSPWPWYIPELVGIGVLSLLVYYAPFWALDAGRSRFWRRKA